MTFPYTSLAALAAFLLLSINPKCRLVAGTLAACTALSLLLVLTDEFYYAAMATLDLFAVMHLWQYPRTAQIQSIMTLSLCSVITNAYGYILWYGYHAPDNYNYLMRCIIIAQMICIWMMRNGRLDFIHDVFRARNTNSN